VPVFDDECRTKPLRMVFGMFTNPFARPLSERPNERKGALWQDPDIAFVAGAVHFSPPAFANWGSGLIGNSGRNTANVCDKHAIEMTRNIARHFTTLAFIIFLRKSGSKVPERCSKEGPWDLPIAAVHQFRDNFAGLRCRLTQV
jgi:hypothetical protein